MLEEDVPMRVVSDQMGHSSTRITEHDYSHVTPRLVAEAGAAIERALGDSVGHLVGHCFGVTRCPRPCTGEGTGGFGTSGVP